MNGADMEIPAFARWCKGAGRQGSPPGLWRKLFSRFGGNVWKKRNRNPTYASLFQRTSFLFLYSSIAPVPARMSAKPIPALRLSFSFSTRPENTMVTKMLSLSMGTTTLANPSWRAR